LEAKSASFSDYAPLPGEAEDDDHGTTIGPVLPRPLGQSKIHSHSTILNAALYLDLAEDRAGHGSGRCIKAKDQREFRDEKREEVLQRQPQALVRLLLRRRGEVPEEEDKLSPGPLLRVIDQEAEVVSVRKLWDQVPFDRSELSQVRCKVRESRKEAA